MKCFPPAKINLFLRVLAKRSDGFHDLHTLFQSIGLKDEMDIELTDDQAIDLSVTRSDVPSDGRNLCYRAAAAFATLAGGFRGCRIQLKKCIPHGAGLGGGSSDAAWTLLALNRLLHKPLSTQELFELALTLGSDVPFFLQGGTALGSGRGEVISPVLADWNYPILLVCPTIKISTPWAFASLKIGLTTQANYNIFHSLALKDMDPRNFPEYFVNDFEELVFAKYPLLGEVKQDLRDHGAFFASLSGTGSTVFGLFFDQNSARRAQAHFESRHSVYLTRPVPAVETSVK